jgi:hypothetical protein
MARKPTPQPLSISSSQSEEADTVDAGPKSSQSLKSPRSPRSPFRFSTKLGQGFGEQPSMQGAEIQESHRDFSSSPTTTSAPSLSQTLISGRQSSRDRGREQDRPGTSPAKGGFFSNYKASKSSSRLQSETAKQAEDSMSRDNDRPAMLGKVSASDGNRSGKTLVVSNFKGPKLGCHANVISGM